MLAREYNKLVEIWKQEPAPDGYGGNIPVDIFVKKIYSKIKTGTAGKFKQFGILEFKNPVVFSVRGDKNGIAFTENHFVKYQGRTYMIKGIENVGINGTEFNLLSDEL